MSKRRRLTGYASIVASFPLIIMAVAMSIIALQDDNSDSNRLVFAFLIWACVAGLWIVGVRLIAADRQGHHP
ncbi:MAG: hypothetical protein MUE55_07150 [Thermoplasmata archaeon]|jgi:NADH:ubiquinone oxidoreductase subunit K|nr:hypothetical protein [Thermoplasmata archaeon]